MASSKTPELQQLLSLCDLHLGGIVDVKSYSYTSCYLWHDRPLYNDFGEQIEVLCGNTIYLHDKAASLPGDLFHELGHLVSRKYRLTGNSENGYNGCWEQQNSRLIAQVTERNHWSSYLNLFAMNQEDFKTNAASELWAELFMLWHLQPDLPEARLIDTTMSHVNKNPDCLSIAALASEVRGITEQ